MIEYIGQNVYRCKFLTISKIIIDIHVDLYIRSECQNLHLWVWSKMLKSSIFHRVSKKGGKINVAIWKIRYYTFVGNVHADLGLPWFSYRTRFDASRTDFRSKKRSFFRKNDFFWFCDKSADLADINEKMLGKVGYNQFWPESIILDISITPILPKLNFRHHTPKNGLFWKIENSRFDENIPFVGKNSKFLGTQKNSQSLPIHPINMK